MDKFIKLLLENENTAILPGFGAIVIENENTGKLMFNEYLKFNDGKLDAIIVDNSTMEMQEAQNYVAKYVREIMQTIDKGESYDIFELGSFTKDTDGKILFDGSLSLGDTGSKEEESTSQPVEEQKSEEPSPEPEEQKNQTVAEEVAPAPEEIPEINTKDEGNKEIEDSKTEEIQEDEDNIIVADVVQPKEEAKAEKPAEEEKKKAEPDLKKEKKSIKEKKPKSEKKKKKKGFVFWFVIILLLLFGAGSVFIALNYDEVKTYMGWDEFEEVKNLALEIDEEDEVPLEEGIAKALEENEESETEDASSDSKESNLVPTSLEEEKLKEKKKEGNKLEKEKTKEAQKEKKDKQPKPSLSTFGSGSYHLIAGTFSDRSNAEKLVADLKSKGHPAELIGVFNGLSYVSVQGFATSTEARDNVERVQKDAPGAWIYKQP